MWELACLGSRTFLALGGGLFIKMVLEGGGS